MADLADAMAYWNARGQRPVACAAGNGCWVAHEHISFVRLPTWPGPPDDDARRRLFWRRFAALVSYPVAADASEANAVFYLCRDPLYDVERLGKKARRDVRLGLRGVTVRPIDFAELALLGHPALADLLARNGVTPPTPVAFAADCVLRGRFACERAFGAFAGSELVAWVTTHRVGAVVDLGSVAMLWSRRQLCATYALVYEVVRRALRDEGATHVGYGLSSLQAESRASTLHQFKQWLGFETLPVRRVFELHPLLRPLASAPALGLWRRVMEHAPRTRVTQKLRGMLDLMRGAPPAAAPAPTDGDP